MAHSDAWIDFSDEAKDRLGRLPAVFALKRMLSSQELSTPMVVGIYGGWGTGKTSVMRTLQQQLEAPELRLQLWFDSWVYARQEEALWRALLLRVVEAFRDRTKHPDDLKLQGTAYDTAKRLFDALWLNKAEAEKAAAHLDRASTSLYRSLTLSEKGSLHFRWSRALPLAADMALSAVTAGLSTQIAAAAGKDGPTGPAAAIAKWIKGGDTKEMVKLFEREATDHYIEQVGSLEQFQILFRELLDLFRIGQSGRRLFIYVDDLDRCLPEDAVAALEAIKLFLDLPGCVFILGMDRAVVEQGIKVRYKELKEAGFNAAAYLDKIIQIPFNLPHLGSVQLDNFLSELPGPKAISQCGDIIRLAVQPNPRTLKRTLNALLLTLYLYGYSDSQLEALDDHELLMARRIAKLVLLQICFEPVWLFVTQGLVTLQDIEASFQQTGFQLRPEIAEQLREGGFRLETLFKSEPRFSDLGPKEIDFLISVTKVTAAPTRADK